MAGPIEKKIQLNNQVFVSNYLDAQNVYRARDTYLDTDPNKNRILLYYFIEITPGTQIGELVIYGPRAHIFGFKLDANDNVTAVGLTRSQDGSTFAGYVKPSDLSNYIFLNAGNIVTFNANANDDVEGMPGTIIKSWIDMIRIPNTKPTRTGYTFSHWNTKSDGTGTKYEPGDFYTTNEPVTLYAIWTPNIYTINYYKNGAMYNKETFEYPNNATITELPSKTDSVTYVGWSTSSSSMSGDYYANKVIDDWIESTTLDLYCFELYSPTDIKTYYAETDKEITKLRLNDIVELRWNNPSDFTVEGDTTLGTNIIIKLPDDNSISLNANIDINADSYTLPSSLKDIIRDAGYNPKNYIDKTIEFKVVRTISYNFGEGEKEFVASETTQEILYSSGIVHIKDEDVWKEGQVWVHNEGSWKEATTVCVRDNSEWKESI